MKRYKKCVEVAKQIIELIEETDVHKIPFNQIFDMETAQLQDIHNTAKSIVKNYKPPKEL